MTRPGLARLPRGGSRRKARFARKRGIGTWPRRHGFDCRSSWPVCGLIVDLWSLVHSGIEMPRPKIGVCS